MEESRTYSGQQIGNHLDLRQAKSSALNRQSEGPNNY